MIFPPEAVTATVRTRVFPSPRPHPFPGAFFQMRTGACGKHPYTGDVRPVVSSQPVDGACGKHAFVADILYLFEINRKNCFNTPWQARGGLSAAHGRGACAGKWLVRPRTGPALVGRRYWTRRGILLRAAGGACRWESVRAGTPSLAAMATHGRALTVAMLHGRQAAGPRGLSSGNGHGAGREVQGGACRSAGWRVRRATGAGGKLPAPQARRP